MSAWFRDDDASRLLEETRQIAWNYLERAGAIDDVADARRFLTFKIVHMIGQGQQNKLILSNRAIAAYQQYRQARTIELELLSR